MISPAPIFISESAISLAVKYRSSDSPGGELLRLIGSPWIKWCCLRSAGQAIEREEEERILVISFFKRP
jgi:hypothetical protein